MTSFGSDSLFEADAFNRTPFARELLRIVTTTNATNGAVVGLAGSWGSGKSWILAKVKDIYQQESSELAADSVGDKIHWVSYSPWALSGSDTLIEAMLIEIAEQIRLDVTFSNRIHERLTFAESVLGYAVALTQVRHVLPLITPALSAFHPGAAIMVGGANAALNAAHPLGKRIKGLIEKLKAKKQQEVKAKEGNRQAGAIIREGALQGASMREARERVCSALKALGGRVVIVIDDLDRMTPKEMVEILQTVKAVADFPQVVYVLAYDPVITASALERTLQVQSGQAFLEKIVRIPLEVPDPSPVKLMQAALKMMAETRMALQIRVGNENNSRAQLTAALMRRPRDLVRLRSRMEFVLPHVVNAIDVDDVVLMLALQIRAPEVVNYLNDNRAFFFDAGHLKGDETLRILGHVSGDKWGFDTFKEKSESVKAELRQMVKALGESGRLVANSLQALNIDPSGATSGENEPMHMRLANLGNWLRLRGLGKDSAYVDNDDLIALLAQPSLILNSPLFDAADSAHELFIRLEPYLTPVRQGRPAEVSIDVPALAETLLALVAEFGEKCRTGEAYWPSEIVYDLFTNASLEDRINIVRSSLDKQSLHETGRLLRHALIRRSSAEPSARDEEFTKIAGEWKSRVYAFIEKKEPSRLDEWRPGDLIADLLDLREAPKDVAERVEASINSQLQEALRWLENQPLNHMYIEMWETAMPGWPNVHYFSHIFSTAPSEALPLDPAVVQAFRNVKS